MLRSWRSLVGDAGRSYSRHGGRMLASAVAFSALLSIAPLLLIALAIAGAVVGDETGRASVHEDLARWIGDDGAKTIFSLLDRATASQHGTITTILGSIVIAYASTRLFSQMKRALDQMWDIRSKSVPGLRNKIFKQIRKRGASLLLVVAVGLVIIGVVILKTILAAMTHPLGGASFGVFRAGEALVTLATTTVMFAALFVVLPDAKLHWRDALRGAFVTAVLFSFGTTLISLYLGHKALDVLYGPGGSLILVLLWVHYSAQVFFFGAAVTGELAKRRGRPIEPNEHGERISITVTAT